MDFTAKDVEWVFSGIGVLVISGLLYFFKRNLAKVGKTNQAPASIVITQNNGNPTALSQQLPPHTGNSTPAKSKAATSILFIDDDTKFKVVSILKTNGWTNTKIIKDVGSLEQPEVASADIFFVDIQGVGRALSFRDEGLGLVVALNRQYPEKKIVIYSAEAGLNAFHNGFKVANDRISKDADPYEFIQAVERLST